MLRMVVSSRCFGVGLVICCLFVTGCTDEPETKADATTADVEEDGGGEVVPTDTHDAGPPDAGPADTGPADAGTPDAGAPDSGLADAGSADNVSQGCPGQPGCSCTADAECPGSACT